LGELQLENGAASSWHSKVVSSGPVETNAKDALVEAEGLLGAEVIEAVKPLVSTVQDAVPAALTLPATSVAVTKNVWAPFERALRVTGLAGQVAYASASSLHRKVTPDSALLYEIVAVMSPKVPEGPETVGVGGGDRSTTHETEPGALVLPAASVCVIAYV
jgi:hypothetical protein